jgi:hypothetical protein
MDGDDFSTCEPTTANQVFVVSKLPASSTGHSVVYAIKASDEQYLACDKHGVVSADK